MRCVGCDGNFPTVLTLALLSSGRLGAVAWPALRGVAPPTPKTYRKGPAQGAPAGSAKERGENGAATAAASGYGGAGNNPRPRHTGQVITQNWGPALKNTALTRDDDCFSSFVIPKGSLPLIRLSCLLPVLTIEPNRTISSSPINGFCRVSGELY